MILFPINEKDQGDTHIYLGEEIMLALIWEKKTWEKGCSFLTYKHDKKVQEIEQL